MEWLKITANSKFSEFLQNLIPRMECTLMPLHLDNGITHAMYDCIYDFCLPLIQQDSHNLIFRGCFLSKQVFFNRWFRGKLVSHYYHKYHIVGVFIDRVILKSYNHFITADDILGDWEFLEEDITIWILWLSYTRRQPFRWAVAVHFRDLVQVGETWESA